MGDRSVSVLGFDTEADRSGRTFMFGLSTGETFPASEYPRFLFTRRYRGRTFVAYNLKYDSGALVQHLPKPRLQELWKDGHTTHQGFTYRAIAYKYFSIRRSNHTVTFYDMLNFYQCSLDHAALKYLGKRKLDQDVELYDREYIERNWDSIAAYCVTDALLVKELADLIIGKLESFGVFPRKLYSVAYITYQYFRNKTAYVTVKRYWNKYRTLLGFAMASYNGGKFEVTEKGVDHYYEYDIVSAYPYEISRLVDISFAKAVYSAHYERDSLYSFLKVRGKVPPTCYSPCAYPGGTVNRYMVGEIDRIITKAEYEYLIEKGSDLEIEGAWHLFVKYPEYPYKAEIERLIKEKERIKRYGSDLDYHTIKILLNSLYGKFVQLVRKAGRWKATSCWNPIYAAVITANCRLRVSAMQQQYPQVVAVHTDSIISVLPLPLEQKRQFGNFAFECEGDGVILGSGIYQIGDKVAFRGFDATRPLWDLLSSNSDKVRIDVTRPHTWRAVAAHGWEPEKINLFENVPRELSVRFDTKRIWFDDWERFSDVEKRKVYSSPIPNSRLFR